MDMDGWCNLKLLGRLAKNLPAYPETLELIAEFEKMNTGFRIT